MGQVCTNNCFNNSGGEGLGDPSRVNLYANNNPSTSSMTESKHTGFGNILKLRNQCLCKYKIII